MTEPTMGGQLLGLLAFSGVVGVLAFVGHVVAHRIRVRKAAR